ncbi:hypothetical protein AVEN_60184-1 [Araneus ventricosus]|uniref:Uncharacterized protein n=1 Tax=Araneus ventricosus TaxID=182803 RepID=A0A4Y2CM22_ARAVE|nr:hypothetical protein AVEN_60184-1 [Araneus ventricosus]
MQDYEYVFMDFIRAILEMNARVILTLKLPTTNQAMGPWASRVWRIADSRPDFTENLPHKYSRSSCVIGDLLLILIRPDALFTRRIRNL